MTIVAQTLDNRIRRVEEASQLADVPLLAALPRLKRAKRRGLVVRDRPSSEAGEAFRNLRTNISFLRVGDRPSLLTTAVVGDRDSAQVPVNLPWTLPDQPQILLVDLDLRRSTVGDMLPSSLQTAGGTSDVLAGRTACRTPMRPTEHARSLRGAVRHCPAEDQDRAATATFDGRGADLDGASRTV